MMKKMLAGFCALLMILSAVGVHAESGVPAPVRPVNQNVLTAIVTPEPTIMDLAVGSAGEEVLALQRRLAVLGFFFTAEDGKYGANTKNAVAEFENYLRVLEQDEIDRMLEANKTPEPTATPEMTNTPEPTSTPVPVETISPEGTADSPEAPQMPEITATPEPTPVPTPEPTPVPTPETPADGVADAAIQKILYGDINDLYRRDAQMGDQGADVLRIQRRLVYLNYLNDAPDGSFGINTENAVKAFQREYDLNETGVVDRSLQETLYSLEAVPAERPVYNQLYLGVTGEDVKTVQQQLRMLGFMSSKVSGTYDEKTQAAVMLLESYLHEIDAAEKGEQVIVAVNTPVPDEILDNQGIIEGDPETNPYEIIPGEDGPAKPITDEPGASHEPEATGVGDDDLPASGEQAAVDPAATDAPDLITEPSMTPEVSAAPEMTAVPSATPAASAVPTPSADSADAPDMPEGSNPADPANPTEEPEDPFEPTGIMTMEMQERLLEEGIPVYMQTVRKGDTGEQVKRVQRRLYQLAYLTANGVDGILGKGSENAIKYFQQRNKLPETGVADQETQAVLFSEDARKSIKPYEIRIDTKKQRVYVYTHDENDEYSIKVKDFICSTGTNSTPTPKGTFTNTGPGARWHYFKKFKCWAQYAYYINGDIMFHSVLYDEKDESTLRKASVSALGSKASHGCVRLRVEDAEWIYFNCKSGTPVIVY